MEVPASTAVPPQGQGEGKDRGGEREERILARRKRVAAKLEAKKRAEAGEEAQEVSVPAAWTYLEKECTCQRWDLNPHPHSWTRSLKT